MSARIHVTGASGSGTTTLGRALARELSLRAFDSDDYYWEPTDPPFTTKRPPATRVELLQREFASSDGWVLSGSLVRWGDPIVPLFTLVIFLTLPGAVRLERLARREIERYGAEALGPGGKMHAIHLEFMAWAARYDDGDESVRSRRLHERWLAALHCPVLRLDGELPTELQVETVRSLLKR